MKISIPYAIGIFFASFLFMLYTSPTAQAFSKSQVERYSFSKSETGQAVYILSFNMGGYSKDLYIPIVGERSLANGARKNRFGYSIQPGYYSKNNEAGDAVALVVGKAEIVDAHYKIPAGESRAFKIISLFKVDQSEADTYQFSVTELPFFVGDEREPQSFNPSELKYMNTSFEELYFERDRE